ncbi:hypothetical protein BRE01_20300 [Brevibacillus reuszeri]|uniref:Uncharacterized protein n=1 Tax=Brevibacillus reuszeri TaxID=54915 RepID=A0A0K9YX45_9BACL|nr:hypothetical protein [Brevibacillus reuszeri]KNB73304.1 hypothetical protein ADS79_04905 [Brevibacillus reuszeri]MED1856923.1 hypothetical protein [Brevibacillus reuszeri]GED68328.1 hypothetical protein BRE01_20300 [Brevibacillus reuszeri]
MAFRDQMRKFEGKSVKIETRCGIFFGCMVGVKSTTIIIREHENNRRTIIRNSQIVAVTEQEHQ